MQSTWDRRISGHYAPSVKKRDPILQHMHDSHEHREASPKHYSINKAVNEMRREVNTAKQAFWIRIRQIRTPSLSVDPVIRSVA